MKTILKYDDNIEELLNIQKKRNTNIFIRFNCCHCNSSVVNSFYDSYFDDKLFCSLDCKLSYYKKYCSFKDMINKIFKY
jgi:hypothetical protein